MNPFNELTRLGKVRRLRPLAKEALTHYDIDIKQLRLLATDTNVLFRVDTHDKRSYVLRLTSPAEHRISEIEAEIMWLRALHEETDIGVSQPIKGKNGRFIQTLTAPGVPKPRYCVLFTWIPGVLLDDVMTPENYYKLGVVAAKLHQHAASFQPPSSFQPMRWDKVFYWPTEPYQLDEPKFAHHLPPERKALFKEMEQRIQAELERLHATNQPKHTLHGDLHMWNVKVYRGKLYPIDFEDLLWGYAVQDIAITLWYGRTDDGYAEWRAAYKEGYSSVRPWPVEYDGQLELLMAGRRLMFVNYVVAAFDDQAAAEFLNRAEEKFRAYLAQFG
ncbi:MAG: phosphotransferase [Chloroflexota bacterium]